MLRHFVAGQFSSRKRDQGLRGEARILLDHEQRDDFAGILVRLRDRGDFEHARVRRDDAFNLVGIHVEAGHQNHVLLSIFDVNEAGGVHAPDVAGAQPIAEHHFLGLIRPVPITAHDLRSEYADFSDAVHRQFLAGIVADRDVGRGNGQADGPVEIQAGRIGGRDRRGFGQAPALGHDTTRHLFPTRGHHCLQGHAAGEGNAQRAEVHALEARRMQQRVEERIDAADEIELVFLEFGHE